MNRGGLKALERELTRRGISLNFDAKRVPPDHPAPSDEAIVRLIRTFMAHVKSNSLTKDDIRDRLNQSFSHLKGTRAEAFLSIYWRIHDAWNAELKANQYLDFDDMLVKAADVLESGRYDPGYRLVLVDEFQDSSQARARLVRALVEPRGRHLLAVGDDWQSINAFAGSDLSVLTKFDDWFGKGERLAITKTFRCSKAITQVASDFIQKNPNQIRKTVKSSQRGKGQRLTVLMSDDSTAGIATALNELSERAARGDYTTKHGGNPSVLILGRYNFNEGDVPKQTPKNLYVEFLTVHRSKGLEADAVIVTGVVADLYGFPSNVADDPILNLAMAEPDTFPHAEERRAFYVALTRARDEVVLISRETTPSLFITELIEQDSVDVLNAKGDPVEKPDVCSVCGKGTMVERSGRNGAFLGCSGFPACKNTRPMSKR